MPVGSRLRSIRASSQAGARAAIFLARVLPMVPSRPIDWITATPTVKRVRYPGPHGEVDGDLYLPGTRGPHPAMLVCLGVVPFETDHPQVPRLGIALARSGFAALLYWSPAMRDLRLDPADIDGIAGAYTWLMDQPDIDPNRSGLLGTCVGGTFALLAAATPAIRNKIAFVTAWAPFASMRTLAREIASAKTGPPELPHPWKVDQLTRKVFVRTLTADLEPHDAALLREKYAERTAQQALDLHTERARLIHPLLTALDSETAETALHRLGPEILDQLDALSPVNVLDNIMAPLVAIAHDQQDEVIPVSHSRTLVKAFANRPGLTYTEFTMFRHLDPRGVRLSPVALLRELIRFFRLIYPMFQQTIGVHEHGHHTGTLVRSLPVKDLVERQYP